MSDDTWRPVDEFDRIRTKCPHCGIEYLTGVPRQWRVCIFCEKSASAPQSGGGTCT